MMGKWSQAEKSAADICRALPYLNNLEKDFYFYTNLIRLYPKKFKEILWDNGPYFDVLLSDLQVGLHNESGYQNVANYLKSARPGTALMPNEIAVGKGRCIMEAWANGSSNVNSCLKGSGSWQIHSYFPEDNYRDIMLFLMDAKTFNALFNQQTTILIADGMKAMVR